jgi:hypothetical protein
VNNKGEGRNKMKNTSARILSMLMIATVVLGFAAILPINAAALPEVYVDPASTILSTATVSVGSTFTVNVTIRNITMFAGLSYTLTWNNSLLQCTTMQEILFHTITPSAFWSNIWNLKLTFNNTAGTADYAQTWQATQDAIDNGYGPANITAATYPPDGSIATCIFTFKILLTPTLAQGSLSCPLHLQAVKAGDINAQPIATLNTDGLYQINYAPPTNYPFFTVVPPSYTASNVGEIFNISIQVNNLVPGWAAVGFEFQLSWNDTILKLLSVTEGPWLPPYGVAPNQGTLFMKLTGPGNAQVGDVVMPDANGTWHPPFPAAGNGTLAGTMAILTFNATMQGLFPNTLSCPLHIYDTKVANYLGQPVQQGTSIDGFYSMTAKVLGRAIDVYTQWPFPFGGQGPNNPSDMFWPQKQVCLYAAVTYNQWPEQQKDVAFQIIDPHGTTWGVIYARTDATGIASTCFRLPWPCDNPEYYIGVWTVVATVDVACTIVNDTVQFHYDYLVRIWKVTADKAGYGHNETACFTVDYGSQSQQMRNVILAVTAKDEVGVPFGFMYKNVTIGGTVFCQYKNFTDTLCIYIPKWARAGVAEIDTAFLSDWPFNGGTVESGYYDPTQQKWLGYCPIFINIQAKWA